VVNTKQYVLRIASLALLSSGIAWAQAPAPKPADDKARSQDLAAEQIEQITVTATKRQTLLQDTPLAVTAVTQKELDRAQVKDLTTMQALVPNLTVEQHGDSGGVHVFLRGIGSTNHTELGDPAVAFHIDGIYSPRPQGATMLMYDLDHVEVLRGPQGTLFGRNATAGSVNLVTAQPRLGEFSGSGALVFGDYNRIGLQAVGNMPLGETFALRLAAITDKHDGYVDFQERSNVQPGTRKYLAQDQASARATALWQPNAMLSMTGAVEYYRDNGTGNVGLMQQPRPGQELYSALIDTPGVLDQKNVQYRGRIDYRPWDTIELTYLGSWSKLTRQNANDFDGGSGPGFKQEHRTEWSHFTNFTHELQLKSADAARFQWLVGAFMIQEDNAIRFDIDISRAPASLAGVGPIVVNPVLPTDTAWAMSFIQPKRTLDSKAVFAQGTYGFTDALKLTLGGRHTQETKEDQGGRNWVCPEFGATIATGGHLIGPGGQVTTASCNSAYAPGTWPGGGANDGKTDDSANTWLGRLEYQVNRDILTYLTYSEGFKSGGLSDGGRRHKPEYVDNFEVGFKSEAFNRRMAFNVAAFLMKYKDMQVSAVERLPSGQQQLVTSNAAKSTIKGIEAELSWLITPSDRLMGNAAWLDAKFDDFLTCDSAMYDCGNPVNFVNLAGSNLRHAPKFSLTATYEHEFRVGGGAVVPRAQVHYQAKTYLSEFNTTPGPNVVTGSFEGARVQDAYTTLDLSLRYQAPRNQWLLEAFVLNATDKAIKTDAFWVADTHSWLAFYNAPRTYGARLSFRF
jgi:iron complex outermembrane recepter protein